MPEYPNIYFITFNKIEIVQGKNYEITIYRKDTNNLNNDNYYCSNSKGNKYTIASRSLSSKLFSFYNNNSCSYSETSTFVRYLLRE